MSVIYLGFLKIFQRRKERIVTMIGSIRIVSNLNLSLSLSLSLSLNLNLDLKYHLPLFSSKAPTLLPQKKFNVQITIYPIVDKRSIALRESIKAQRMALLPKLSIPRQIIFEALFHYVKLIMEPAQLATLPYPGNLINMAIGIKTRMQY